MAHSKKMAKTIIEEVAEPILVSACLLGVNCKYNGENNANKILIQLAEKKCFLPVCPEILGGLPTPRAPQSITGGAGKEVLEERARVLTNQKKDVTEKFLRGAQETLRLARLFHCRVAILKERSPSCGVHFIHSYDKKGTITYGEGVTTALLQKNGLQTFSEEEIEELYIIKG